VRANARTTEGQPCRSSNQVTVRPPHRRHPHRAASPATSQSPRPPSASPPTGRTSGNPGATAIGDLNRTMPPPAITATVTVSPESPDLLYRTLLPKSSLVSRQRHPRTDAPGRAPRLRTRGRPAPALPARPATVPLSRTAAPVIAHHPFPATRTPGKSAGPRADTPGCTLDSAVHVKPEQAASAARPWPSVEKPTVRTDRPGARTPSAIRPWTPRHSAPQRDKVIRHGTEKKRPAWPRIPS
jgi:hypothetical protein